MLKYKPAFDREAVIIDYKMGDPDSKYKGMLGSFICRPLKNHDTYMSVDEDDDHIFTLSGMDDKTVRIIRKSHPKGTIITYECSGFTDKGFLDLVDIFVLEMMSLLNHILLQMIEKLDRVLEIFIHLEKYYKSNYDTFRAKTYMGLNKILKYLSSDKDLEPQNMKKIKGIGQGTIDRIKEIIDTGITSRI